MSKKQLKTLSHFIQWPLLVFIFGIMVFLTNCNKKEETTPPPTDNLFDLVKKTEGLDSLAKYLNLYPEIATLLKDPDNKTFFAPNNEAFVNLLASPGFPSDISQIKNSLIVQVLKYHIANQDFKKKDLVAGQHLTTAEGEDIIVNDDLTLKTGSSNPAIAVAEYDLAATNGTLHKLGSVLVPPTVGIMISKLLGKVGAPLMMYKRFTDLSNAILKADGITGMTSSDSLINILASDAPLTVFAPTDEVFTAANITVADFPAEAWRGIILYHIITGSYSKSELIQRTYTSLIGEQVYITNADAAIYVNGNKLVVPDANTASNGMLHVMAGFLFPGLMLGGNLVGVADFQIGFDSLVVALNLAGLSSTLQGDAPYTLLAPPNQAFDTLLVHLGVTALNQIPLATLQGLMAYHIITGYKFTSDFANGISYSTLFAPDGLNHLPVKANVSIDGLGFTDGSGVTVPVIGPNMKAINGVIHVIGGILQPE